MTEERIENAEKGNVRGRKAHVSLGSCSLSLRVCVRATHLFVDFVL